MIAENVGAAYTHQVCHWDGDAGQEHSTAFVGDVVVVPCVEQDGRCGCAPFLVSTLYSEEKLKDYTYHVMIKDAK